MSKLRSSIRILGFVLVTGTVYVARLLSLPFCLVVPALNRPIRGALFRWWGRNLVRVVGIRLEVHGRPPDPPFFLVSNHLGYLDIAILASQVNAVFISRHDLAEWPLIGRVTRLFDTLYINRERLKDIPRVGKKVEALLDRGEGVVAFPEGTSSGGAGILPLKAALLAVPARRGMPVYCATIHYETPADARAASHAVCWHGEMDFLPHLRDMLAIPSFSATLTFAESPVTSTDRRELTQQVENQLLKHFRPVTQEPGHKESE